jgi:hypothetical protein
MQASYKKAWSTDAREKITQVSKGISEILAGLAEPLMRYSTIYLALATSIPVIYTATAYNIAEGIVIAAPEFVLLGAFTIAEDAIKRGQKKWGAILFTICLFLAAIMIATFVDIFIVSFSELAIHILNFARCLTALGFSVALGKLQQTPSDNEKKSTDAADDDSQTAPVEPEPEVRNPKPEIRKPEPEPQTPAPENQTARAIATIQSHHPEPVTESTHKDTRNQEERLEAAYQQLLQKGGRISGRGLAPLAHVNRATATKWLEVKTGATGDSQSHPEPVSINTVRAIHRSRNREVAP